MPLAAKFRRNQQRAPTDVVLARERRDTQEIKSLGGGESEHAGVIDRRTDDVVVRDRTAVVAVGIGKGVPDGRPRGAAGGLGRPGGRRRADDAHQAGIGQNVAHAAPGIRCA